VLTKLDKRTGRRVVIEDGSVFSMTRITCFCGSEFDLISECSCPRCGERFNIFGQNLKSDEDYDEDY